MTFTVETNELQKDSFGQATGKKLFSPEITFVKTFRVNQVTLYSIRRVKSTSVALNKMYRFARVQIN